MNAAQLALLDEAFDSVNKTIDNVHSIENMFSSMTSVACSIRSYTFELRSKVKELINASESGDDELVQRLIVEIRGYDQFIQDEYKELARRVSAEVESAIEDGANLQLEFHDSMQAAMSKTAQEIR